MCFILVLSLNVSCGKQAVFSWCLVPVLKTLWCFLCLVLLLYNGCDLSSVIHLTWCVRWCLGELFFMSRLLKELWSTSLSVCLICRQVTTRVRSKDFVFLLQCVLLGRVVLQFWPPSRCCFADQAVLSCLLIPRDFPHVVLTSLFVCARYLWHRWIHFIEKGGGSFQRGWHPLVFNLDEDCYYYRFHLFSIKNEEHLTKHSFVSACTERFFDTVFGVFPVCLWKHGSAVRLWVECNMQGASIKPIVLSSKETTFGYLSFKCFPSSWVLFCNCLWPGISNLSCCFCKFTEHCMSWLLVTEYLVFWRWWHRL